MSSMRLALQLLIDKIDSWWEHNDALHVDRFYIYLCYCLVSVDALEIRPPMVDLYVWWT